MKYNKKHGPAPSAGPQSVPVHFKFIHPTAVSVSVAGCFNHWQPEPKTRHPAGGGQWVKEAVLPPGTYEYCFVVDGQWMPDPLAANHVPNPFGGKNSVLTVLPLKAIQLAEAENLPPKKTNQRKTQKL